jgi:hypothetical protein
MIEKRLVQWYLMAQVMYSFLVSESSWPTRRG